MLCCTLPDQSNTTTAMNHKKGPMMILEAWDHPTILRSPSRGSCPGGSINLRDGPPLSSSTSPGYSRRLDRNPPPTGTYGTCIIHDFSPSVLETDSVRRKLSREKIRAGRPSRCAVRRGRCTPRAATPPGLAHGHEGRTIPRYTQPMTRMKDVPPSPRTWTRAPLKCRADGDRRSPLSLTGCLTTSPTRAPSVTPRLGLSAT